MRSLKKIEKKTPSYSIKMCVFLHEEQSLHVVRVGSGKYSVFCNICGASGPMALTPEEAIAKWNNREVVILEKEAYEKACKELEKEDGKEG